MSDSDNDDIDLVAIYALHEQTHGLPGMLGSMDCMHWDWKNCPMAWMGQFHRGDHAGATVILEAVASQDAWIWHAFFGVPGATNDIIVVNQSPVFNDIFEDKAPDSSFVVNGTHYKHGYYLVDGMYPEWTTFVKAFRYPSCERRLEFKKRQESARKDIERTFATLKDKWHVVKRPALGSDKDSGKLMWQQIWPIDVEFVVLKRIILETVLIHVLVVVMYVYVFLRDSLDTKMNSLAIGIGRHKMSGLRQGCGKSVEFYDKDFAFAKLQASRREACQPTLAARALKPLGTNQHQTPKSTFDGISFQSPKIFIPASISSIELN
ncbi:hypothetical protein OSB04_012564 [Centaurea solstitialis]|uniref:Protein ALP1-like n=1 Tax=Centaurea solstitialis TaxID=347529 RepID=A0AA38TNB4_9ASTR|nr:hypothetical protein OSB04_012564 [Centaurea solstitialis]